MNTQTTTSNAEHHTRKLTAGLIAYAITLGFYLFASGVGSADMTVQDAGDIMAASAEIDTEASTWAEAIYGVVARIGVAIEKRNEVQPQQAN